MIARVCQLACAVMYRLVICRIPSQLRFLRPVRVAFLRGMGCRVAWTANINAYAQISRKCVIDDHAGVGERCVLGGEVHLGRHVTMGPECWFITGDHPVPGDLENFRDRTPTHRPIVVEEDVFVGARATVLPGVRIGRGAAIGAGAVVTRDVAPGATVVGNPAREVRRRTPPEQA